MVFIITYIVFIGLLYYFVGIKKITSRLQLFKTKDYWTDYNIIEFASWMAKAIIIVPGLTSSITFK